MLSAGCVCCCVCVFTSISSIFADITQEGRSALVAQHGAPTDHWDSSDVYRSPTTHKGMLMPQKSEAIDLTTNEVGLAGEHAKTE
jgi:hypothetical protein